VEVRHHPYKEHRQQVCWEHHPYEECMIKYKFVTETIGKIFLFVYFYVSHVNGTVALGEVH